MDVGARRSDRLVEFLGYVVVGGGAFYLLAYAAIALVRIRYPYHLEWMEGGCLQHVQRILAGEALYVPPSLEFTPYTYPPFYFYASAAVALLFGDGFLPLRLVSFLSSLGCFAILFLWVRRETGSAAAGLLAAGLFAATFRIGGAWFDLARIDSLFLVLLLAGAYLVRFGTSTGSAVAAAALLALSFLTKQTALLVIPGLAVAGLLLRPRWALRFLPALAVFGGGSALLLDWLHEGWFRFYAADLPSGLHFLGLPVLKFLRQDVLEPLWIACAVGLAALAALAGRRERRGAALFYVLFGLSLFGAAYLGRNKMGGFLNALQPVHLFLALLAGLAAGEARGWLRRPGAASGPALRPALRTAVAAALYLACLGQLALLAYDPRLHLPSREDRRAGDRLVNLLRQVEGEVLVPEFNYLAGLAGKRVYADSVATWDVARSQYGDLRQALQEELETAVGEGRFGAILFSHEDWDDPSQLGPHLGKYSGSRIRYERLAEPRTESFLDRGMRWELRVNPDQPNYTAEQDVFLPLVGFQLRPALFYTLNR